MLEDNENQKSKDASSEQPSGQTGQGSDQQPSARRKPEHIELGESQKQIIKKIIQRKKD